MEYFKDRNTTLYLGDCLEKLKIIPDNSIDCIVTDPPYGFSFMGKEWDKATPSINIWKECLRVLKPGAFAFIMCTPRQDCLSRMIINLQDSGFRTDFTSIYWTYASGFPKGASVSKSIDKKLGISPIDTGIVSPVSRHNIKENLYFSGKAGKIFNITLPSSDQAKQLNGSYAGFQPKPSVELILVVMKPLTEKTFTEQALNNGKGITWLDACRIPYKNENDMIPQLREGKRDINSNRGMYGGNSYIESLTKSYIGGNKNGRFPANLLVSDDILNDGNIRKSGQLLTHHQRKGNSNLGKTFEIRDRTGEECNFGSDSGSFSRYFDLDIWWENKIKELPDTIQKTFPFLIESKASKSEKNKGLDFEEYKISGGMQGTEDKSLKTGLGNERNNLNKNNHPTVKPIKLMSYLITLGSREGEVILDPFMGSGSTNIAAKMLNRQSIGIEREENYIKIAKERIKSVTYQNKLL